MILSILPNWQELDVLQQTYWVFAIPSTLIFLILLVLTLIGGDVDSDVETDIDDALADGDSIPFQFISLKNIVAFFAMLGWSGLGFIEAGLAVWMVILFSVLCGLLMMLVMATLFFLMSKLAETGTLKMANSIGCLGEVYLKIPERRKGMGKVQLTVQGALRTLEAITDDEESIATSSIIEVVDVIDNQILLVKRNTK